MPESFHQKPYDAGTLAKLQIFELYAQEWLPVFRSKDQPVFRGGVHIFDFFAGPGSDSLGIFGSPLHILTKLRAYFDKGLAGWGKLPIVVHFYDADRKKVAQLEKVIDHGNWRVPGVVFDIRHLPFQQALKEQRAILEDRSIAKLLFIDQFGVDEVSDPIFKFLAELPTCDFIFFLSSSTLHRFRNHPAIKQKIDQVEDSYEVHRAALAYYRKLLPADNDLFLGSFSIKKKSNIYGLIFGSHHPLGIHKVLQVAWSTDEIAGEANFDIDRENIRPDEGILAFEEFRPNKVREFEQELESALRSGTLKSEADVIRFCVEAGMTCSHAKPVLKKLKTADVIRASFEVPSLRRLKSPLLIELR